MPRKPKPGAAPPPSENSTSTGATSSSAARVGMTRGERVCAFIERFCRCPEGDLVGQPIKLSPFQRKFILETYDNPSITDTAILSTGKKNGKTSIIAGLLLAHLAGPEAVQNSQIVSGARSKEQAALIFDLTCKMIAMDEDLSSRVRVFPSGKKLLGLSKNVSFRALAAEGKTAHGISPLVAILDELGQVQGPTDPFVNAIVTAQGAYSAPLLIAISTQAPTDADLFSSWIDAPPNPKTVCHVYTADPDCDLLDEAQWAKANPGMGVFRSKEDIRKQAERALAMPANEPDFRNLILNQRVERVSPFVTRSVWESNSAPPQPGSAGKTGKKWYAGLDLSSVNDLTALVAVSEEGDVECEFFLPEHNIREKARLDKVPWNVWADMGFLTLTPGKAIEYKYVAARLRKFFDERNVELVGFDRYLMKFLEPWLVDSDFSDKELERFVEFGQGTASMTPALRELEVRLLNSGLRHGSNPILTMCANNARVVGESGARKFDKIKSRGRIDGMVALAMAVGVMPKSKEEAPKEHQLFFV